MDERNPSTLATTGGSTAEPASAVEPRSGQLHQPVSAESDTTIVYCGDAESVRAGFSLALGLMQVSSNLLLSDIAPLGDRHTPEEN